ncbi:hypothetical protein SAMN05421505_10834 [Sinosporangium album]|uniref:FtsH ternary system domain-containing protein n=1 Tax=Sinosporangium album TaxID=504805 RepID=A0A1G7X4I3_9ACTN|nr:hypothetical protein [Sinosporangium album]SDG79073.1 hypothetical protein SAMN05421505_10834 [Sinosporangium album]
MALFRRRGRDRGGTDPAGAKPRFTVTRLPKSPADPPQPAHAEPPPPAPPWPAPTVEPPPVWQGTPAPARARTAGWFSGPGAALAFAGSTGEPDGCYTHPELSGVWVLSPLPPDEGIALVEALGGFAYTERGGRFAPAGRPGGRPPPRDVADLRPITPVELAAALPPAPAPLGRHREIIVVTETPLMRSVVERCLRVDATVAMAALWRRPLYGDAPQTGAALVYAHAEGSGPLPDALLRGLAGLPRTLVCRESGPRLLTDVRLALPLDDEWLAATVPDGQQWMLGAADAGAFAIVIGTAVQAPVETVFAVAAPPRAGELPTVAHPVKVRLTPTRRPGPVDAVLVHDDELDRLREFLAGRPLTETGVMVLGDGAHLLTEPSGLLTDLPLGTPLSRLAGEALYVEAGFELYPPIGPTARARAFGLAPGLVAVATRLGSYLLSPREHAVPVWSLWLAEPPAVRAGLSARARALLDLHAGPAAHTEGPRDEPAAARPDRGRLLTEALRLELDGDIAEAAQRLEQAGELYRAARLFERAAGTRRGERA